jgi:hypothetical protein
MSTAKPRALISIEYFEAAQAYLRSLPPEHFMESIGQATQRKITLESLDLVHARRPEVQVFNELLVQYPYGRQKKPRQVVPDNMVVVWKDPIKAEGSFDIPLQPVGPLWVLEYVSRNNKRKDYEGSFQKYERELKVPYYLVFYPEDQELTLYHHSGRKYVSVKPNEHGRCALPELDLEMGLLEGWVRYWYQGELLPLPADLLRELDQARQQVEELRQRADQERQRADQERQARLAAEREVERLRARLAELQARPEKNG